MLESRPWKTLGDTVQSAREVEGAFPQLEQQLSTALEFGADREKAAKFASPQLVAALVNQAGERSEPLNFAETIRWKQLVWAFAIAFVLALFMGVYAARSSRLFAITWARFMKPTADVPAPTLTEISNVEPGDVKSPMESSVTVAVALRGKMPDTAILNVLIGDEKEGHWEPRPMDRGDDGLYRATIRRLLDSARYKISAGDAESREFKIKVFKTPEITEFALRIEHPAYTGKGIEPLAPGTGDLRALRGSKIHVDVKANVDLGRSSIAFKSRRGEIGGTMLSTEPRKASIVFDVDKDDEYQIKIADTDGNPGTGSVFQIKSLRDRFPRVSIKKPEKDLMVSKEQTVEVEITADDDIGVREIGIIHSIDLDEKQIMVRRMEPQPLRADGKLIWELGTMNLKGGEVITYFAYALDNDGVAVGGPKMSKSDIHFLTVYDEEKYDGEKDPKQKKPQPGTPPEIKQLDKLIDAQKKLLKDTFAQARVKESLRDKEEAERVKSVESEKASAAKTGEGQKGLRARVEGLIDEIKKELAKAEDPEAKPVEGEDVAHRQKPALGEKELKHLEQAVEKMKVAEGDLQKPDAPGAVKPETEALRHLSETRRLLLSDKEGDPRFKMAMNKNSKKKQKQEQDQQQQDQQKAKEELAEMPKMLEKEKELERELEELNEKKRKPPQGEPQSEERKKQEEEKRSLQRKAEEAAEKLAKEAEERARTLERLAERNADIKPAADKMKDAAEKLEQAKKEAAQGKPQNDEKAKEQSHQAQQDTHEAQRNLRNALEKQVRQELANIEKDAKELAQKQQDLAQQIQQMKSEPQGEKQSAQKQDEQKQDGQKQDGQKQDGQKQDGQKQDGQKQDGQKQDGQKQDGQKQDGQKQDGQKQDGQKEGQKEAGQPQDGQAQSGSQQSAQQRMRNLANDQRNIRSDLKELNERVKGLADKAEQNQLAGSKEVGDAQKQSSENSPANQGAEKAAEAMASGKQDEAAKEAQNAAKALQKLAETMQDAKQKTEAGDMKQLANAMKKLQGAAKEQADIGKDLGEKKDANQLANRQEKVGETAKEVADAASHLETLRQTGMQDTAKGKLETAEKQANEAAKQMKEQNSAAAKAAADQTEKSINQALADMERAAGKTMEEKAREAQKLAKAARENQEKANAAVKDVPNNQPGEKLAPAEAAKRDEAAAKEEQAAADAKKLDLALDGLKELAKDANPAAAEAAKDARETTQKAELPKAMDNLANDMKRLGTDKKPQDPNSAKTPAEANKKGEEIAQTLKQVDKQLDEYVAESRNSVEERLKVMEDAAKKAAESATALAEKSPDGKKDDAAKNPDEAKAADSKSKSESKSPSDSNSESTANDSKTPKSNKPDPNKLGDPSTNPDQAKANDKTKPDPNSKNDPKNPDASKEGDEKSSEQDVAKQVESLKKQMKKLQPKLDRLEANAPERGKMKDAMAALENAEKNNENPSAKPGQPQPGTKDMGGAAFKHVGRQMEEIAQGIMERRERLLRARDIKPDEDEDAPKEYRTLVDKYYRALSEDVEEERK